MKPSVLSTSSTRSRCLEPGIETFDLLRIWALRMRVIISPIGSFTAIAPSVRPALHKAGNGAFGAKLAQRDTAQTMLAIERTGAPRQFAAITHTRPRGIPRQFSKLQRRRETLLHRQLLVLRERLEFRAPVGELLRHLAPPVVLFDRTLLSHTFAPCGSAYEGCPSLPEREVECGEKRTSFFVGACAGADGNVEAPGIGDLVEIDFRKDRVFLDAEAVIPAAIEALGIEAAKIAHTRKRDAHEAIEEVVHPRLAQRDLAADGLAVAQF